jgi:hypothetical protein
VGVRLTLSAEGEASRWSVGRRGKARMTLSFPDWPQGGAAPATFEVLVVDPERKVEGKNL